MSTRPRNPAARTASTIHDCVTSVMTASTTTPAATVRAASSLTGLGKEKKDRMGRSVRPLSRLGNVRGPVSQRSGATRATLVADVPRRRGTHGRGGPSEPWTPSRWEQIVVQPGPLDLVRRAVPRDEVLSHRVCAALT